MIIKMEFNWESVFVIRAKNEENNEFIITIGNHLATEQVFNSREDAQKAIRNKDWNLIAALVASMVESKIKTEEK